MRFYRSRSSFFERDVESNHFFSHLLPLLGREREREIGIGVMVAWYGRVEVTFGTRAPDKVREEDINNLRQFFSLCVSFLEHGLISFLSESATSVRNSRPGFFYSSHTLSQIYFSFETTFPPNIKHEKPFHDI
jgi:hypothetical protein